MNKGYNESDQLYYTYADDSLPKNIGPGIAYTSDIGSQIDYNRGYTKDELNNHARSGLLKLMNEISDQMHQKYGDDADTMSLGNRLIQLDIAYNVRPRGNKKANMPITGWPTLTEALMTENDAVARKNTYSGSRRRSNMRNQLLWLDLIDATSLKNE